MATMFLAFNDCFRTCTPAEEYFEYGLWLPPDETYESAGSMVLSRHGSQEFPKEEEEPEAEDEPVFIAPEKVNEAKKEFESKYAGGKASTNEIADYGREQGLAPSQEDIRRVHEKYGDNITFDQVHEVLKEFRHSEDKDDFLVEFFEAYDPKKEGTLSRRQMEHLLSNFGEPLTAAEIDEVLKVTGQTGDRVDYRVIAKALLE